MAAATYRIGPSDFFTPGDLQADAGTVQSQVDILDAQIEEHGDPSLVEQWTSFHHDWTAFYEDHFDTWIESFASAWNDANRDALIRYENQLASFQTRAAAAGAETIAPVGPSSGSKDTLGAQLGEQAKGAGAFLPSLSSLVVVAVAVIAVVLIWRRA